MQPRQRPAEAKRVPRLKADLGGISILGHLLKQRWSLLLPVVLMAGMLGLIASCGSDEVVMLSESGNGTTVNVDDGNIIELSLKANPATGSA